MYAIYTQQLTVTGLVGYHKLGTQSRQNGIHEIMHANSPFTKDQDILKVCDRLICIIVNAVVPVWRAKY
jgi:hypothetical protein